MKKALLFLFLLVSGFSQAAEWINSFEDAQKIALGTNKFMIVDFWATWCGPCKQMDKDAWSDAGIDQLLSGFVAVKIDIDHNRQLAMKYGVEGIPNMFIIDGNGKVVHSFMGYHSAKQLKDEIEKFALSTEFFSMELISQFKNPSYNGSTRLSQKYFDYSLMVDKSAKHAIVETGLAYLIDAKSGLSKKDENYAERIQKIKLFELYEFAYNYNFDKLDKKLGNFDENSILEHNQAFYYFLKLVAAKGLKHSDDVAKISEKAKTVENGSYYIDKADILLSKQI